MDSHQLAQYLEQTNGISKPWLLAQLRLVKLQECRHELTDAEYIAAIADIQQDVMRLGEWWVGQENEVF